MTQRPLRDDHRFGGSRVPIPREARGAVEDWVDRAQEQGIQSMIVLTSHRELAYYTAPTVEYGGLLGLYRKPWT